MSKRTALFLLVLVLMSALAAGCTDPSDNSFIAAGKVAGDALEDAGVKEDNDDVLLKIGPLVFTE